jgi:hypothetical protein
MKKYDNYISLLFFSLLLLSSCAKLLEVDSPKENVRAELVFSSDATAVAAMAGVYYKLVQSNFAAGSSLSIVSLAGMSSDELALNSYYWQSNIQQLQFYKNQLLAENEYVLQLWNSIYKSIYDCNAVLEGLASSSGVSQPVSNQLKGEALFVRAFCHFYAVNLFGNVPLILSTDYTVNRSVSRMDRQLVYEQIVKDLVEAKSLLQEEYVKGTNLPAEDRARVNKFAAISLLARVYLYSGDWLNAATQSTIVLNKKDLYDLNTNVSSVFRASTDDYLNKEAIWQLMPIFLDAYRNTGEGNTFIISSLNAQSHYFELTDSLRLSFEPDDARYANWVGKFDLAGTFTYFAYKYKLRSGDSSAAREYSMVLRVAELYLIRAEARAQLGNFAGAKEDIDVIRDRASLSPTTANSKASLLIAIEQERRVEFFCEWGHRWFDLKRWKLADARLNVIKAPGWQADDTLYPLPLKELNLNKNLKPQNMGYF